MPTQYMALLFLAMARWQLGEKEPARMGKDKDLDSLRGREDFKKLVQRLLKQPPMKP